MGLSTKDLAAAEKARMDRTPDLFEVPVTTVPLPSRGKTYPPESPLFGCDSLDVKAMSAVEENILASPALIKKGTVLGTLMKACVTNRMVDPDEMLAGDRNALLVAIRVASYGARYEVEIACPRCGETAPHAFDLGKLPLRTLDEDPMDGPGGNSFPFDLPTVKRRARFKLLNAREIARLDADVEAHKKNNPGGVEPGITLRLRAQVLEIEGIPAEKLARAIDQLPARDARALRQRMDDVAPGVDMQQSYGCPSCGKETVVDVPVGAEFFWPSRV